MLISRNGILIGAIEIKFEPLRRFTNQLLAICDDLPYTKYMLEYNNSHRMHYRCIEIRLLHIYIRFWIATVTLKNFEIVYVIPSVVLQHTTSTTVIHY